MERSTTIAQAAQAPTSGASNAEDFQPPTRNPQPTQSGLQPGGAQSQQAGGQDLLLNPNATISITKNPADGGATTAASPTGINWPAVIVISLVIVVIAELWFRRRDRKAKPSLITAATASTEALEEEAVGNMPDISEQPAPTQSKKSRFSSKKKSKSKRKHK